jgi:hypothetical protein
VPSPSAVFRYLEKFHAPEEEAKREKGKAFLPTPTEALKALYRIHRELLAFKQAKAPQRMATLDMDATLHTRRTSAWRYFAIRDTQPISRSRWTGTRGAWCCIREFRDGNVPAGFEPVRVLHESLQALPKGVEQVCLRTDTAGYDHKRLAVLRRELLRARSHRICHRGGWHGGVQGGRGRGERVAASQP